MKRLSSLGEWAVAILIGCAFAFCFYVIALCDRITKDPDLPLAGYRHVRSVKASWYETPGLCCATRLYPVGSFVRVMRGRVSLTLPVRERGPARWVLLKWPRRQVDLSRAAFAVLADLGTGVIDVQVELVRAKPTEATAQ